MTVGELIVNLQATEEMDKEVLIDIDGVRYRQVAGNVWTKDNE